MSPAGIKQKMELAIACPALLLIETWATLVLDDELRDVNDQASEIELIQCERTWSAYDALLTAASFRNVRVAQVLLRLRERMLVRIATSAASCEDTNTSPTAHLMRAPEQQTSSVPEKETNSGRSASGSASYRRRP